MNYNLKFKTPNDDPPPPRPPQKSFQPNYFLSNFFIGKLFSDPKFLMTKNFFWARFLFLNKDFDPKLYLTQKCF